MNLCSLLLVSRVDSTLLLPDAGPPVAGATIEDSRCQSARRRSARQGRPSPDRPETSSIVSGLLFLLTALVEVYVLLVG